LDRNITLDTKEAEDLLNKEFSEVQGPPISPSKLQNQIAEGFFRKSLHLINK